MSSPVYYIVTATITRPAEDLAAYVNWLNAGHVAAVVSSGAVSGDVVVLEGEGVSESEGVREVESVYVFPSKEALQAYFDGPAIELRKEGVELWINTGKVTFKRRIGTISRRY